MQELEPPKNVLLPIEYWDWANNVPSTGKYPPTRRITKLNDDEVFVFGSNASGFHGAGAAGWAYTGKIGNQYRKDNPLLKMPKGTPGFWAQLGVSRGFQQGTEGKSYAICTIINPGLKRSIPLDEIRKQVLDLYKFATEHPEWVFYVPKSGEIDKPSLNGYTLAENASCYLKANTLL